MFAKSSFILTTILSFILMLLTSPLIASALPIASPNPIAAPAALAMPQAHNHPTSLMGRTIILRSAAAEAEVEAVDVDVDMDPLPINRAERFALRMERARARRLA